MSAPTDLLPDLSDPDVPLDQHSPSLGAVREREQAPLPVWMDWRGLAPVPHVLPLPCLDPALREEVPVGNTLAVAVAEVVATVALIAVWRANAPVRPRHAGEGVAEPNWAPPRHAVAEDAVEPWGCTSERDRREDTRAIGRSTLARAMAALKAS